MFEQIQLFPSGTQNQSGLFGLNNSNRDFTIADSWGKNQFNSSFPAALACYLSSRELENVYLKLRNDFNIVHSTINTTELYGLEPNSPHLYYSFETQYVPYQQHVIGSIEGVDLVTLDSRNGSCLRGLEIKLTALPDNTTCLLHEQYYGCELVVRPPTIIYLACSIAAYYTNRREELQILLGTGFEFIKDWSEPYKIIPYIDNIIIALDRVMLANVNMQSPLIIQPVWKTEGKSAKLAENCLDVFVWSNLAFTQLFMSVARGELHGSRTDISRQIRTIIWLFKTLYDYANGNQINFKQVINDLTYNTKNDKAFAISGRQTNPFMSCPELTRPRITKDEIKNIILGGGQNLLSPERRFDAILFNSPELFN